MYRKTAYVFGLVYWMAMMTYGMFFPLGETPYGAIPFYIVIGLTLGRFVFTYPPKDHSVLTRA
jgi:hypothetical protein